MGKYWLILTCLVALAAYCAYAGSFHAWITATPVSAETLHRSQAIATGWSVGFIFAIFLIVCVARRMILLHKHRRLSRAQEITQPIVAPDAQRRRAGELNS